MLDLVDDGLGRVYLHRDGLDDEIVQQEGLHPSPIANPSTIKHYYVSITFSR